jgi:protein tyrosine/serine phosphatase
VVQLAADDRLENYQTHEPPVRRWLETILEVVTDPASEPPTFVHCAAGRDRTGVAIAAILHAMGVPEDLIIADHLMTDGVADETQIQIALRGLAGFAPPLQRFNRSLIDRFAVR